ncbi:MAG TPA: hypothetical protein VJK01_02280 [Candidatus Paceibacterota bacterium]
MIFGLTLNELWEIFQDIWATGNRWTRIALAIIVGWPILLLVYALGNPPIWSGSLMALIPVIALFILIMTRLDPMVLAVVMAFKKGRTVLSYISTIVGIELAIGVYCTLVRIGNDPELAMLLILFLVTYIFLAMGVKGNKFVGFAKSVCVAGIIILTAIFIFGGREEIKERAEDSMQRKESAIRQYEVIDGLEVPYDRRPGRPRVETQTVRLEVDSGKQITLTTNCQQDDFIIALEPGETARIRHVYKPLFRQNQCSFSITKRALPIYGLRRDGEEAKNLPRFENDLPFPELPAHANVFYIKDGVNRRESVYIKNEGGAIRLTNYTDRVVEARQRYNYPDQFMNQQIGWDGSTATFEAVKY